MDRFESLSCVCSCLFLLSGSSFSSDCESGLALSDVHSGFGVARGSLFSMEEGLRALL